MAKGRKPLCFQSWVGQNDIISLYVTGTPEKIEQKKNIVKSIEMTETTCSSQNWWENLQESLSQYIPIDLPTEAILIPGLTEVGVSSTGRPARNAWAK